MTYANTQLVTRSRVFFLASVIAGFVAASTANAQSTRDLYGGGRGWQNDRMARSFDHDRYASPNDYRGDRTAYHAERDYRAADRYASARESRRYREQPIARAAYHPASYQPLPPVRRDAYRAAVAAVADTAPCYDESHRAAYGGANPYPVGYDYAPPAVNVNVGPPNNGNYIKKKGRYVGRGVIGQPTLYAKDQPLRNLFRAFSF